MTDAMNAAPKDRPVLVLAKWHWVDGQQNPDVSEHDYAWRVAEFREDEYTGGGPGWFSCADNPYTDKAYEPKEWVALPSSPIANADLVSDLIKAARKTLKFLNRRRRDSAADEIDALETTVSAIEEARRQKSPSPSIT